MPRNVLAVKQSHVLGDPSGVQLSQREATWGRREREREGKQSGKGIDSGRAEDTVPLVQGCLAPGVGLRDPPQLGSRGSPKGAGAEPPSRTHPGLLGPP